MLLWFCFAVARAAELAPGLLLPAATPVDDVRAGAFVAAGVGTPELFGFAGARGAVGFGPRLTVEALFAGTPRLATGWVGARYAVVQSDGLRVAPWLLAGAAGAWTDGALGGAVLGVALEGGWARVRLDGSVPLVLVAGPGLEPPVAVGLPAIATTFGVSARLGDRHVVRLGVESLGSPALTWGWLGERVYTRVTVGGAMLAAVPTAVVEVGGRWGGARGG